MALSIKELELRANALVDKLNTYESEQAKVVWNEEEIINQHLYADIFSIRPVINLLFGKNLATKLDRSTTALPKYQLVSSSAPANNTFITDTGVTRDTHEFMNDLDSMNLNNQLVLDIKQKEVTSRDDRIKQGIDYLYSSNIADALVTESQVANTFKWNTTDDNIQVNNSMTVFSQVPGIVCYYLGNGFDGTYTATVPQPASNTTLQDVSYSYPTIHGAYYLENKDVSQTPEEQGHESLKLFYIGSTYTDGRLTSPQQIFQPEAQYGDDNTTGYNYQGQALYHELVFKDKLDNGDFVEPLSDIPDNDPQGLATRVALAKQKEYYINRPWFTELDSLKSYNTKQLADKMNEVSVVEKDFVMPTLTANGTLGGDQPACQASTVESSFYPYCAFNGDSSTKWGPSSPSVPQYLTFYNPEAINVSSVDLDFGSASAEWYQLGAIQGSNDNTDWTELGSFDNSTTTQTVTVDCDNSKAYKYIRFNITKAANWGKVYSMIIKGKVRSTSGPTSDNEFYNNVKLDYDTYKQ